MAPFSGNIDEVRITKGSNRGYTGTTITVPTVPFSDFGPSSTTPGAPTSLSAVSRPLELALSWTAPASNGGSAINNYVIEYTPSGGAAQTINTGSASTSYTLTGLTAGTSYTVRVAALNAIGTGAYSSSTTGTPSSASAPGAPSNLTISPNDSSLDLSWTVPAITGGVAITSYVVEYTPSGGVAQTVNTNSTNTTYTLTGLNNRTPYTVRIAAVNSIGTGSYSATSTGTPGEDPSFSNVSLLLHMDRSGTTFTDSSQNGFAITASGDATQSTTRSRFGSASGAFTNGRVQAPASSQFDFGTGDFAVEFWVYFNSVATNQRVAGGDVPTSGGSYNWSVYTAQTGQLMWYLSSNGTSWNLASALAFGTVSTGQWYHVAIARNGNTIRAYLNGSSNSSITTSAAIFNNTNNGPFFGGGVGATFAGHIDEVRVTKGNNRGYTGSTITVPTVAFANLGPSSTTPAAPTSLSVDAGAFQLALSWTAPASNGGHAITDYVIEYTPSGGVPQTVNTGSATTSYILTGLTAGTSYTVRVAAVNALGTGTYSSSFTGRPTAQTAPGAPTNLTVSAKNLSLDLSWAAPINTGGVAITDYVVEYTPSDGVTQTVNTNSTGTTYTLAGLTNRTSYTVRVAAVNSIGTGSYSATSTGTPGSDSYFANVALLMSFDGANGATTFVDKSNNAITTFSATGAAALSTSRSKFGSASLSVASGAKIADTSGVLSLSQNENFTVEGWVYRPSSPNTVNYQDIFSLYTASPLRLLGLYITDGSRKFMVFGYTTSYVYPCPGSNGNVPVDQWTHVAMTRSSGIIRSFINGTLNETSSSFPDAFSGTTSIGGNYFSGNIDEFRITRGIARYTATFTPPTDPFPDF